MEIMKREVITILMMIFLSITAMASDSTRCIMGKLINSTFGETISNAHTKLLDPSPEYNIAIKNSGDEVGIIDDGVFIRDQLGGY